MRTRQLAVRIAELASASGVTISEPEDLCRPDRRVLRRALLELDDLRADLRAEGWRRGEIRSFIRDGQVVDARPS